MTAFIRQTLMMHVAALAMTVAPWACTSAQTNTGTQQFALTYGELRPTSEAKRAALPLLDHLSQLAAQHGALYFRTNFEIGRPNFFMLIEVWPSAAVYSQFIGATNVQQAFTYLKPLLIAPLDERDGNLVLPQ